MRNSLSSDLFNELQEQLMRNAENAENHGMKINIEYLSHLQFDNDITYK